MALGSASDNAFMAKDAGVPVVFNGTPGYGILDVSSSFQSTDGADVQVLSTTLLIPTGSLGNLRTDAAIVVNKAPYWIRAFDPVDDGEWTLLQLAERR